MNDFITCVPVSLPSHQLVAAATLAAEINPMNRPFMGLVNFIAAGIRAIGTTGAIEAAAGLLADHVPPAELLTPGAIAAATGKYWGAGGVDLPVTFLDVSSISVQNRILSYANLWSAKGANVKFRLSGSGDGVRIATGPGGYYSYLGPDIKMIPRSRPTMNLERMSAGTPDSECLRVIPHEFGHTLGFVHEHLRRELVIQLDERKTIAYFEQSQGWSEAEVRQQVLTPIQEASLLRPTPIDASSVMCYWFPGSCTKNGQPIIGGHDIDPADYEYVSSIYPGSAPPIVTPPVIVPPVQPPPVIVGGRRVILSVGGQELTISGAFTIKEG